MANPLSPPPGNLRSHLGRSTYIPLLGDRSGLMTKTHFIPIFATIIAALALSAANSGAFQFIRLDKLEEYNRAFQVFWILGAYITFLVHYYIYMLCGRDKPLWLMAGVFITMATLMWHGAPLWQLTVFYNDHVLGDPELASPTWRIFGAFFGPGLGEEFIKALPLFALALVAVYWKDPFAKRIGIFEPLDGILIGVVSAAAFALIETMGLYIYKQIDTALMPWIAPCIKQGVVDKACVMQAFQLGAGDASFAGLMSVLTRGLPAIAGHLAYSGVFGYFIGLAVLRPSAAPRILLTGWLMAAALHGVWDAAAFSQRSLGAASTLILILIALFSYAFLASAILKARKISPTRSQNFATVVTAYVAPQPLTGPRSPQPQQQSSPGPAAMGKSPPAATALVLKIGPVTRTLAAGMPIEPILLGKAGAGRGKAPIAEIAANSSEPGVLGLRNLSDRVYRAKLPTGKMTNVSNGQTVRLSPGVVIDFGGIEGIVQAK